jgi:hypothetical protein
MEAALFAFGLLLATVVVGLAAFTWIQGGAEERKTAALLLAPVISAVMGFLVGKGRDK